MPPTRPLSRRMGASGRGQLCNRGSSSTRLPQVRKALRLGGVKHLNASKEETKYEAGEGGSPRQLGSAMRCYCCAGTSQVSVKYFISTACTEPVRKDGRL